MKTPVWRDGSTVFKKLHAPSGTGALIERTRIIREAAVPTPAVWETSERGVVAFDAIDGKPGLDLVKEHGPAALKNLLAPVSRLHAVAIDGLPVFDPLLKIRRRIAAGSPGWIAATIAECLVLTDRATGAQTLHGDLHVGQTIRDDNGTVWLLDLDDLSTGSAEADLGNLAAHLATRPETRCGSIASGFDGWLTRTLAAYAGVNLCTDPHLARAFGRLALIRRALKLRENGAPEVIEELARQAP